MQIWVKAQVIQINKPPSRKGESHKLAAPLKLAEQLIQTVLLVLAATEVPLPPHLQMIQTTLPPGFIVPWTNAL